MIFRRLRTRMVAHIIWIVASVTIVTAYFVYNLEQRSLQQHLQDDAAAITEIMEELLLAAMQRQCPASVNELVSELSKMRHVHKIRIAQFDGNITFSSESLEPGTILNEVRYADFIAQPLDTFESYITNGDNHTYLKLRKLKNDVPCQQCHDVAKSINGVLWVETMNDASQQAFKTDYWVLIGLAFGAIIFLALATIALFIRSVDRPVQELKKTMVAIEQGDFSARVQTAGKDELGQLAIRMNAMAKKLHEARKHLVEHHEQELVQAESIAKIGELAASLAHEIKNPISGIVFAVNSILRDTDPKDNRREIFEEIVKQANRVEQNLEGLLAFARQNRLERFPTDLNAIIERIMLFIRQQADMKRINTENILAKNLPEVLVDPKQIEQILLNLITNALQAMPDGGRLTISTTYNEMNNSVGISIKDTGQGIKPELQDKIFQPFFTTKEKGVGLGLALCKEVVTKHNGRISFKSKTGIGTTFTLELPVGSLEV